MFLECTKNDWYTQPYSRYKTLVLVFYEYIFYIVTFCISGGVTLSYSIFSILSYKKIFFFNMFIIHFFFDSTHTKNKSIYFFKHTSISSTRTHPSNTHIVIDHFISISKTSPLYILHTMQSRVSNDDRQNNQLKMITQLNKKHEILTILQLCKSHLKIQQYNSVVSTDILI